jgi:hypothetical protein
VTTASTNHNNGHEGPIKGEKRSGAQIPGKLPYSQKKQNTPPFVSLLHLFYPIPVIPTPQRVLKGELPTSSTLGYNNTYFYYWFQNFKEEKYPVWGKKFVTERSCHRPTKRDQQRYPLSGHLSKDQHPMGSSFIAQS